MYAIGDMVVCPMHGVGKIEKIETREVDRAEQKYYSVALLLGNIHIMVPVALEATHMRCVVSQDTAQKILLALPELTDEQNSNWSRRYRENMDKLKSGDLMETARVFKSLHKRNHEKTLSAGERKMLHSAKQILVSELMVALQKDAQDMEQMIYDAIG